MVGKVSEYLSLVTGLVFCFSLCYIGAIATMRVLNAWPQWRASAESRHRAFVERKFTIATPPGMRNT
jgi:hypothetical protein